LHGERAVTAQRLPQLLGPGSVLAVARHGCQGTAAVLETRGQAPHDVLEQVFGVPDRLARIVHERALDLVALLVEAR